MAIYDKNGTITHSYINGPNGRIGVYWNNLDTSVYYFLTDHLGSTRVMVDRYGRVREYVNYDPFGEVLESWASYSEPLTFTGKQRDQHSTFAFYYFGSRYYDYRIGQFASVDKAGQFAGGYLYGGNNPIIGTDPDGNFFWLPVMIGALAGSISGAQIAYAKDITGLGFYGYVFGGALIGAASGAVGGSVAGAIHSPVEGGLLAGGAGGLTNGLGMGTLAGAHGDQLWDASWKSALSGAAGGWVGGTLSTRVGGVYSSFAGGFVGGSTGYALTHSGERSTFWESMGAGAIGGLVSAGAYKLEAAIRYHRKSFDAHFDLTDREQLSIAARKSNFIGREVGGDVASDGRAEITGIGTADDVEFTVRPGSKAMFHTHVEAGLRPGELLQRGLSGTDIAKMNSVGIPSMVISPHEINIAYPGIAPSPLSQSTNYYLMLNYYNLALYGDYRPYATWRY